MKKLHRHLKEDINDERKGISTYSKRKKQHPFLGKMYESMKKDEEKHEEKLEMPLSKYFGGGGEKVMKNMKKEYGEEKGEKVFYATANKNKKKKKGMADPSEKMMKKHKVN